MTSKTMQHPRKMRNTAKQSIIIQGQPDFLYRIKDKLESFIIFDNKKKSLGNMPDDIYIKLCDISAGTDVKLIRERKSKKIPVCSIEGFSSINIHKYRKDYTMLIISAPDETSLIEKVTKLKEILESKGCITQERCNWICIVDKAKVETSNEEILNKESIVKIKPKEQVNDQVKFCEKNMSDKTKKLREMAIKAINKSNDKA